MHLVQLLLPLYDNEGNPFPKEMFTNVRTGLTEQFGGVTAFMRSPAVGLWKDETDKTVRDEVIMMEILTETIDQGWWKTFREKLCQQFRQDEIIIRASQITLL